MGRTDVGVVAEGGAHAVAGVGREMKANSAVSCLFVENKNIISLSDQITMG